MSSSYPTEPAGGPNEGVDHPSSNHESDDRLYPTRTAENYNRSTLSTIVLDYEGGMKNGLYHGEGYAQLKGGQAYEGEFYMGRFHGTGVFQWEDGTVYEGEMNDNAITGRGKYTWNDGSTYEGDVRNGNRHGQGIMFIPALGCRYEGSWKNGLRDGLGRLMYDVDNINTPKYMGEWAKGKRHGTGTMVYESGNKYEGQWKNDRKHGQGSMTWRNQNQTYKGEWKDDHPDGEGEYIWGDIAGIKAQNAHIGPRATHLQVTNRYSGDFEEGVRHGKGTFYYSSGAVYDGEWQDNAKEGQGQYSFENGSVYVGGFANDRMTDKDVWQKQDVASFDLDVDDLLVELSLMKGMSAVLAKSEGVLMEQKQQLAKALLRINSDVLAVYHFYAAYNHNKAQLQMRMYQLWLFFRHAGLISAHVTLAEINRLVHHHSLHPSGTRTASLRNKELSTVHDPNHKLILRDFVECIVRASYFVVENEWTDHAELNLAQRVSLVFGEMMFPKYKQVRAAVTGYTRPIWARKLLVDAVDKHRTPLRAAFIACAANNNAPRIDSGSSTDKEGGVGLTDYTITVRGMLGMLRKRGLLSDTLTITKALELIVTDTGTSVAEVIAASNTELGIPTIDPSVSEPPSSSMLSPSPSLLHSSSASPSKGNRPKLVPSLALSSAMKTPSSPKSSALNTSASNGTNGVFEAAPIQPQDHLDKEIMFDDFLESLCRVVIHMFEAEWKEQKVAEWEAKQEADATAAAAATEAEAGDDIGSAIEDDANGARSSNEHINEHHIHDNTNDHHHLNTSVSSHTNPHLQARERGSLRGSLSKGSLRRENTKTRIKTGRNRSGSNTGRLSRQSSRQSSAMFTIDADNSGEWKMERKRQSSNEAAWEKGVAACAERIVAVFLADTAGKKEIVALEVKARALMAREAREREQGQEQGNSEHDQEE